MFQICEVEVATSHSFRLDSKRFDGEPCWNFMSHKIFQQVNRLSKDTVDIDSVEQFQNRLDPIVYKLQQSRFFTLMTLFI